MRKPSLKTLIGTLLVTGLVILPSVPAMAAKVDFSEFRGKYTGRWTLFASGGSAATNSTADVKVPANGSKMIVTISGIMTVSGETIPIQTTLRFSSRHKLESDALLMGYNGPILTLPARFSGRKKFKFAQTAAPGATFSFFSISGTMLYTLSFTNSKLVIQGSGTVEAGSTNAIVITVNATKKKQGK